MRSAPRIVLWIALAAFGAHAQAQSGGGPDLDRLLKLPDSIEYSSEQKAGATRNEWRQRFYEALVGVDDAEKALDKAQRDLKETVAAKSEWQLTPPGMPTDASASEDSSSAFQLRQEVKRRRGEVDRAKARLRDLEVEANLAGVPAEWRTPPSTSQTSGDALGDDSETDTEVGR